MNLKEQHEHLAEVKLAISTKYEHLASIAKSKAKRASYRRHAATYRRLAVDLKRA